MSNMGKDSCWYQAANSVLARDRSVSCYFFSVTKKAWNNDFRTMGLRARRINSCFTRRARRPIVQVGKQGAANASKVGVMESVFLAILCLPVRDWLF